MTEHAPASRVTGPGDADARPTSRREGTSSAELAALYAPVIAILSADRGEQINRVAAMLLEITEARDAETLHQRGDFRLRQGHPGAAELDRRYKPMIAMLLAPRASQYATIKALQQQIRDARDAENMAARGVGERLPGRPAPVIAVDTARMLAPQGGVGMRPFQRGSPGPGLAVVQDGPSRDRRALEGGS